MRAERVTRPSAGRFLVGVGSVLVAAGLLTGLGPAARAHRTRQAVLAAAAATTARTGCGSHQARPLGPFRILADRHTVVDRTGRPFISYGLTVPGLSQPNYAANPSGFVRGVVRAKDIPKINAIADVWCGNTVRLQVSQYDVTPNGRTCDYGFLRRALDVEVHRAEKDHLVVVINDNTESDPAQAVERDPTTATFTFWRCVARHREHWLGGVRYGSDPQVIFDIFNEPRADSCNQKAHPYTINPFDLNLWRNGGTYSGCGQEGVRYQGMDAVVYHIRQDGAQNLLWVEGPGYADTLSGLTPKNGPSYLITDRLNKVVYAIHHPYTYKWIAPRTKYWYLDFGYLIKRDTAPVVEGEWTNFTPKVFSHAYCWPDAPVQVPYFLGYLARLGIGLNGYQLAAGTLLTSNGPPWTNTTNYAGWRRAYCQLSTRPPLKGAGSDLLGWFRAMN
ncbi:MAG: cellulase family glycosylhydrolase [Streptosporangiaceae bacterium]